MEGYRESGYYDVPSDNIDLNIKGGCDDYTYAPRMGQEVSKKMAAKSKSMLKSQKYDESRYS